MTGLRKMELLEKKAAIREENGLFSKNLKSKHLCSPVFHHIFHEISGMRCMKTENRQNEDENWGNRETGENFSRIMFHVWKSDVV